MDLNWKNIRKILLLITYTVLLYSAVQNINFFWSVLVQIISLLKPLVIGLCLAFILNVIMRPIESGIAKLASKAGKKRAFKGGRIISLVITLILTLSLFALVFVVVIPQLKETFTVLKTNVPTYYEKARDYVLSLFERFNLSTDLLSNFDVDWSTILSKVTTYFTQGSKNMISSAADVTATLFSSVSNFLIGFILCIYILLQKERLGRFAKRVFAAFLPEKVNGHLKNIIDISNQTFTNFISSKGIEAVILGVMCFVGMLILRLPYAAVSSLLIAVFSFIPYIGSFLSAAVSAFLILMTSPVKALIFIIFFFVLQAVEGYLVYPKIVGKSVGLPGILVLLSIIVGSKMFGVVGMLVAVPTCSVLFALFKDFITEREKSKKGISIPEKIFSDETDDAVTEDNGEA